MIWSSSSLIQRTPPGQASSTMSPAARLSLLCLLVLLPGCPRFQQTPNQIWGDANMIKVDQRQIFVREAGSGPAVLMIHGYGAAHDTWGKVIPRLAAGRRVLAVDLPGFGRSDKYARDLSPASLGDTLFKLLDQKHVQQVDLIAHSWGSSIALAMTLKHPERIRSITLLGAWVYEEQLSPFLVWSRAPVVGEILFSLFYDQRLDDRMALAFHDPDPFAHPDQVDLVRTALGRPGAVASALAAARGQRFTRLQRRYGVIKQPVLLIWGQQDRISRPAFGQRLANELERGRLVVIPQCGHIPMVEQPRRVLQELERFLAAVDLEGSPRPAPTDRAAPALPTSAPSSSLAP